MKRFWQDFGIVDALLLGALVFIVLALTGCASTKDQIAQAQSLQAMQRPTLEVDCPAGGCKIAYRDPRDQGLRLPTNGWDFAGKVVDASAGVLHSAVVPAAFAFTATRGFRELAGSGATTTTTTTSYTSSNSGNTTNTDSTHAPTIVTQPAPVIVTQPAPTVVNPVVVNPVVVTP